MGAERHVQELFPASEDRQYPDLPERSCSSMLKTCWRCIPDLPRKQRETAILQKYPAVFIIGIGWTLKDGYPHEMRAADYDDWVSRHVVRRRPALTG